VADAHRLLQEASVAAVCHRLLQEASVAVECRRLPQEASVEAECHRLLQEVSEAERHRLLQEAMPAVEWPAWIPPEELPAALESQAVDRTPQVSRYSGSLFRQPLLLASCPCSRVGRNRAEHATKTRNSNT